MGEWDPLDSEGRREMLPFRHQVDKDHERTKALLPHIAKVKSFQAREAG